MTYNVYQDNELIKEGIEDKEYTVDGLTPNTEYSFGVSEVIGDSESEKATVTVKTKPIAVTGVTLEPAALTIDVDETANVTATVAPSNATNKTISLKSSDESIATVNGSGKVTGAAKGEATITVTTTDGKKTATSKITVKEPVINVTGVEISPKTVESEVGETKQLSATASPSNADDKTVSYASKASGVASVDDKGLVTAKAAGTAEIVVTTADGDKKDTCVVTVVEPEPDPEPE